MIKHSIVRAALLLLIAGTAFADTEFVGLQQLDQVFENYNREDTGLWPTPKEFPVEVAVEGGLLSASHPGKTSFEGPEKAFDGDPKSKYLVLSKELKLRYQSKKGPLSIAGYAIRSGNDFPGRDPANWTLSGSVDGVTWKVLDKRNGEGFKDRHELRSFSVEEPASYAWYQFAVSKNSGHDMTQLAELELLSAEEFQALAADAIRPNILFIFADDWGWGDLSCHGHPYVKTPNIDRLAEEGTDFHRFTVASGVCSPSRAAVVTGQFPARRNIDGHFAWVKNNEARGMPDWLDLKAPFLPRMLKEGGYATAHFGKWHLANNMIPDSPSPGDYGYDEYGAFNCSGEQMPVHEDADRSVAFIEKAQQDGKPFFINLWLHEPHTPFHTVPKYRQRFPELEEADNIYASVLSHADDRIGEVLDALDRLRIADNTLVIFSSDNGPARAASPTELKLTHDTATGAGYGLGGAKGITAGRKGYKSSLFEGGINVPFIARWPGRIAAGQVDDASLISAVDLLPTFCEVAGVALPSGYAPDGVSQVSVLLGSEKPLREKPLYWKYESAWPANASQPDHWVSYVIVDQQWKLVANKGLDYVELYDLATDPYETKDLKVRKPEVVSQLLAKMQAWQKSLPEAPTGNVFSAERKIK